MGTEESGKPTDTAAQVADAPAKPADAQSQDAKPADAPADKPAEAKPADKPADKPAAIEYQPFKLPEGVKLEDEVLSEFTAIAKEKGLSQEVAQALVDKVGAKLMQTNSKALENHLASLRKGWIESAKTDKDIGGDKFAENTGKAAEVFNQFGSPALKELLEKSGIGDHPEMIRWALNVSKAMGEDTIVRGRLSDGGSRDPASVLYDNNPKAA